MYELSGETQNIHVPPLDCRHGRTEDNATVDDHSAHDEPAISAALGALIEIPALYVVNFESKCRIGSRNGIGGGGVSVVYRPMLRP